jgi:hypothetical protein
MGRKPVGKVAMTPAERQRLYMQRLKDKAAANGKRPGPRQIVSDKKTTRDPFLVNIRPAWAKLKRLAQHKGCSVLALIERLATAEEHRVTGGFKRKGGQAALKRYYEGR